MYTIIVLEQKTGNVENNQIEVFPPHVPGKKLKDELVKQLMHGY